jgi:integrase/recombinase XerD
VARSPRPSPKRPVQVLTSREVSALIHQCSPTAPTGIRNRALITVMYRGALRIDEALSLRPADVDPAHGTIRVLHGKGDKARTVWIDDGAMAIIQRWMDAREKLGLRPRGFLLCTLKGGQMSDRYVRTMMHRIAGKAGITKRVHPHQLRHSWAHDRAMEGVPSVVIQAQLGHAHLSTTDAYLRDIAPADVVASLRDKVTPWNPEES